MSVIIGNTRLKHGLMLAPMAGVTDCAFRHTAVSCGAEYTVTEMVSAKALHFSDGETAELAKIGENELPCAVQIFGHEPDIMAEAVEKLLKKINTEERTPTAIDINMGCPMKKIVSNGDGSALMKLPELAGEIIKSVVSVSSVPVTVKFRTGWDKDSKNAVKLAEIAEKNGASLICIHGRTRDEMYTPPVDLDTVAEVKRAVSVPVIGNGGIFALDDAKRMLDKTRCDGLMIARGAMGNPWLFAEIAAYLDGKAFVLPTLEERIAVAMEQVKHMVSDKGEHKAILEARRQLSYYIKGEVGAAETRYRLNTALTLEELYEITDDFLSRTRH